MRLKTGEKVPLFETKTINGESVNIEQFRGKKVLISFYRYAACPLCNLRVHHFVQNYDRLHEAGLHVIAFFESPAASIRKYMGKHDVPFPIIPDPQRQIYKQFGVESSVGRFFKSFVTKAAALINAMARGYIPGIPENDIAMLPADFLIGPDLTIVAAYYGDDIGDHMPFEQIETFLKESEPVA